MKTRFTLLAILVASFFVTQAQIGQLPNFQFQAWTNPYTPDGWVTPASLYNLPVGLTARDTIDKLTGAACSIELYSDSIVYDPAQGVQPGVVSVGTGSVPNIALPPVFDGYPFTYRPDTIFYAIKFVPGASDTEGAMGVMRLTSAGQDLFVGAGGGFWKIDTASFWKLGEVILTSSYTASSATPDTLLLQFIAGYGAPVQHQTLHLQEVFFAYVNLPSGIKEVTDKLNINVYPNPTSDVLNITSAGDMSGYKVVFTDLNGAVISINTLTGERSKIDVHTLASGTYTYRIADKDGNIFTSNKFIVTH